MTECYFCGVTAITKNEQGIETCKNCKDKSADPKCPVCNDYLDVKTGKYGSYFFCWKCSKNWSKSQLKRFG